MYSARGKIMKTNENQKSTNHQPAAQKPFFGTTPDHAFFSAERAASPPFFQPKAISPSVIQAKSATSEAEGITQPLVQRMPAFESEITANGEVQRKLINSSALPIQAKLTIGEPGDKYEQEADRVASQVVEQINAPVSAQSTQGQSLQRQEEPKEELQAKPEITTLQRMEEKPEELQAKSTLQRQEEPEEELQAKPEITTLQRMEEKPEELQAKSTLQRAIARGEASTDLTSAINIARGGGQAIADNIREPMEVAFGADFSGVKIHTDGQSDQLNRSIQARAFTTGQDVFFRQGEYNPGSRGGQELIAHELTHVVQQNGGAVMRTSQTQEHPATETKYASKRDRKSSTGHLEKESLLVQRVTYKETKYEPGIEQEQENFLAEAEKDLKANKAWVENRSKRLVKALGLTDNVIPNVDDLILKEKGQWKGFDVAIEKDIQQLDKILKKIKEAAIELAEKLPKLKTDEMFKEDLTRCSDLLRKAQQQIPEKMRLKEEKILYKFQQSLFEYIAAEPWLEKEKRESLKKEQEEKGKAIEADGNITQRQKTKQLENLTKDFQKREKALDKISKLENEVNVDMAKLVQVPEAIPNSLRKSAEEQFTRGQTGYRFSGVNTISNNKLYIGQIEDTMKIKDNKLKEKGRGVLWATPWAPGVNVGFIEGGIAGKQVFKLKTDIPAELISYLEKGEIAIFKAEVKDKTDKEYWPFWHGIDKRFTQFTIELETLIANGYKLKQFKRKNGSIQQVMATDDHMSELQKYYKDRN
jgi:hypothetical protein